MSPSSSRSVVSVQMPSLIPIDNILGALLIGMVFSLMCEVILNVMLEIDKAEIDCTAYHACNSTLTFLGILKMIGPS